MADIVLPLLRPEIEICPGPPDRDGAATWLVADRLRGLYFAASWGQGEILRRLRQPLSLAQLINDLERTTTLRPAAPQILALCAYAVRSGLCTVGRDISQAKTVADTEGMRKILVWRVTLVRSDAFLERTLPAVRYLASLPVLIALIMLAFWGFAAVLQRLDLYAATFLGYLHGEGMIWYALTATAIKALHELGHAYAAKAAGCRVRGMGITLFCLWPIPFCDVTDLWRVPERNKRLAVSLAGVAVEMAFAGAALAVWACTEPGIANSLAFVFSSTAILSACLVNLNPLMRFDGYYALCDLLRFPNLRPRAAMALRWALSRFVLGCSWPRPEGGISAWGFMCLLAYALAAAAYRLGLTLAMAALAAGAGINAILAGGGAMAIMAFMATHETKSLVRLCRCHGWRPQRALLLSVFLLAVLLVPLPRSQRLPAVVLGTRQQKIYTPYAGEIRESNGGCGCRVKAGETIAVIANRDLESEQRCQVWEENINEIEMRQIASPGSGRERLKAKQKEKERLVAEKQRTAALVAAGRLIADFDGEIVAWDEAMAPGVFCLANEVIAMVAADRGPLMLRIYAPEAARPFLKPGAEIHFACGSTPWPAAGRVCRLMPLPVRTLDEMATLLAAHGRLPAQKRGESWIAVGSWCAAEAILGEGKRYKIGETGVAYLPMPPASIFSRLAAWLAAIFG